MSKRELSKGHADAAFRPVKLPEHAKDKQNIRSKVYSQVVITKAAAFEIAGYLLITLERTGGLRESDGTLRREAAKEEALNSDSNDEV